MSGKLARFYGPDHEIVYFGVTGAVAIVAGLVVVALSPLVSRHMEGVH
jgi:POT family proton-dependent oligopeptide transporter